MEPWVYFMNRGPIVDLCCVWFVSSADNKRSKRRAAYFNIFLLLIPQSPWGLFGGVRLTSSLEPSAMMKRLQACENLSAAHFSRHAALAALYPSWPFRETANPNMQGRKLECTWVRLAAWHQCFLLSGALLFIVWEWKWIFIVCFLAES